MPTYLIKETCHAVVTTTYRVEARTRREALAIFHAGVRSGSIEAISEEVNGHQGSEVEASIEKPGCGPEGRA